MNELLDTRLSVEEQQHQARQAQVAFLGNQAIDNFYANMGQNIQVAHDVEARVQEETHRRDREAATAESARADRDRAAGRSDRPEV